MLIFVKLLKSNHSHGLRHLGTGTIIKSTLLGRYSPGELLAKSQVLGLQSVPFFMTVFLVKQSFEGVGKFWFG